MNLCTVALLRKKANLALRTIQLLCKANKKSAQSILVNKKSRCLGRTHPHAREGGCICGDGSVRREASLGAERIPVEAAGRYGGNQRLRGSQSRTQRLLLIGHLFAI